MAIDKLRSSRCGIVSRLAKSILWLGVVTAWSTWVEGQGPRAPEELPRHDRQQQPAQPPARETGNPDREGEGNPPEAPEVKPFALISPARTVNIEYFEGDPAWRVVVDNPNDFKGVDHRITFSLFRMPTGALLAYWLRLYDIPDQPYFVHRALDLTDPLCVKYARRMAASKRLVVLLRDKGDDKSVNVKISLAGHDISALVDEGLKHHRQLENVDGPKALDEFTSVFNKSLQEHYEVDKAWEAVRNSDQPIRKRALGKEHPAFGLNLAAIAVFHESQGAYADAKPLYEQSLGILRETLGEDHADYRMVSQHLARLLETAPRQNLWVK